MHVLVDEAMPVQVVPPLRLNRRHTFDHVDDLGWKGKPDVHLFADAAGRGYDAILTLDLAQLESAEGQRIVELSLLSAGRRHQTLDPRVERTRFPYWR